MAISSDETSIVLRYDLSDLWPGVELESGAVGDLQVLSARTSGVERALAPELRFSWLQGDGEIEATVHLPTLGASRPLRIEAPGPDPRGLVEAALDELRHLTDRTWRG